MMRRFIPDPFLLLLIASVVVASILPAVGRWAVALGWMSSTAIVLLFFFAGAKLPRDDIIAGLTHWRLHLAILATTFGLFPAVGLAAWRLVPEALPDSIWIGMFYVCALPSTVQSAIALVSLARGNLPAAIASASASQLLGVILTPLIMSVASARSGRISVEVLGPVALQILLPFAVGHIARPLVRTWMSRSKRLIGLTDRATIILAVYSAFSAAVVEGIWRELPPSHLIRIVFADALLLACALLSTALLGRLLGFATADAITLQFCGTKKSLVQGAPMAKVLFAGPQAGVVLLPLMVFHQMQLMACASLAKRYGNRSETLAGALRLDDLEQVNSR